MLQSVGSKESDTTEQLNVSMGFPRQEYWSGLPFPFPGDLPDPGIKPSSLALQVGSLPLSHQGSISLLNSKVNKALYRKGPT